MRIREVDNQGSCVLERERIQYTARMVEATLSIGGAGGYSERNVDYMYSFQIHTHTHTHTHGVCIYNTLSACSVVEQHALNM